MDKGEQAEKHRDRCNQFLDQTKDEYVVDPDTRLYRLKTGEAKQEARTTWTAKVAAFSAFFGVSISALGLLVALGGLILSVVTVVRHRQDLLGPVRRDASEKATEKAVKIASGTLQETKRSDDRQQQNNLIQQQQNRKAMDANQQQNEKALQATIDNFRLDQRAWIGFQSIEVERNPKVDTHDKNTGRPIKQLDYKPIRLTIVNTGKTPAVIDRFEDTITGNKTS